MLKVRHGLPAEFLNAVNDLALAATQAAFTYDSDDVEDYEVAVGRVERVKQKLIDMHFKALYPNSPPA